MLFKETVEYFDRIEATPSRLSMIEILTALLKKSDKDEIGKLVYIIEGILVPPFEGIKFGVADKTVGDAIVAATGYTKSEVETLYKRLGDLGLVAQQLREKSRLKGMREVKNTVSDIYNAMLKISKTSGRGSKAEKIKQLVAIIATSTPLEAKYAIRYLLGELRLGAGDSTILEALSVVATGERRFREQLERAYNLCSDLGFVASSLLEHGTKGIENFEISLFKPIRPALAERLSTPEEILAKLDGRCAVEQKYDGFRCQVHKKGKNVKIFSRRLEDTTAMFPDIAAATKDEIDTNELIIDAEALAYNDATGEFLPFQETMQRKRKHGIGAKAIELPLHLEAFDLMYLNGRDYMDEPYSKRREALERVLSKSKTITPAKRIVTSSVKELSEFFESSVENGLEGIVAKDLDARYIAGARKFTWIKMKRSYKGELFDTLDLVVVGYFVGRGSRAEFQFGGLLCATYNEKRDMFETISKIGSGFTEAQMIELEEKLRKTKLNSKPARVDALIKPDFWVYPKYVVTVKADEITKSPTHTCGREKEPDGVEVGYALRFPRLVGDVAVRSDKSPDEATTTKEVTELYKLQKKVRVEDTGW